MRLEDISAVLRPRSANEAMDLGLALTRRHYGAVMRAWFCVTIPLWTVLALLFHDSPGWLGFFIVWLKPLYERMPLYLLSRGLFGAIPSWREQMRASPQVLFRGLLPTLLWRRLSLARTFLLPVTLLEGLRGKSWTQRVAILNQHGGAAAFTLLVRMGVLETAILCALLSLVFKNVDIDFELFASQGFAASLPAAMQWGAVIALAVGTSFIGPFYAGAGFGLYVNSRTHLEGWDIELTLRQLGARLAAQNAARPSVLVALMAGFFLLLSPAAQAQDVERASAPAARAEAKPRIKGVLEAPEFEEHKLMQRVWVPEDPTPPSSSPWSSRSSSSPPQKSSPVDLSRVLSVGQVCLWLILGGLLAWLIYLIVKHVKGGAGRGGPATARPGPRTVMGMEVTPESLPDDLPTTAWKLWQDGRGEEAVRLLFRGGVAWLVEPSGLPVRESDTEGDLLTHAGSLTDESQRGYFARLIGVWLSSAYASVLPEGREMQDLCSRWPFVQPGAAAARRVGTGPALAVIALAFPLLLGGCTSGHWEEKEKELGYEGEAKLNPWLAAERFLNASGFYATSRTGLGLLPESGGVMLLPSQALTSEGQSAQVQRWVQDGGHLIIVATGGERYRNDWEPYSVVITGASNEMPVLKQLGIHVRDGDSITVAGATSGTTVAPVDPVTPVTPASRGDQIEIEEERYQGALDHNVWLDLAHPGGFEILAGTPQQPRLVTTRQINGRITVLANAHPWRNRYIDDDDNAAILEAVAAMDGRSDSEVFLVNAGKISLWEMLRKYAWMPVLALGVLLVAWLWRYLPRFGPVQALTDSGAGRFVTHLDDAGQFLWAQHMGDSLLDSPRRAVISAAARGAIRDTEPQFLAILAERSGLPSERVHEALYAGAPKDYRLFTRLMADLQTMLQALGGRHS